MIEDEIVGSHTEDHEENGVKDEKMGEIMSMFGVEDDEEDERSFNDKSPAKETVAEKPEPKTIKVPVKINKEQKEVELREDEIPELYEKSFALDKERERKSELEKNLDRAAKLAGYPDHAAYVADFDRIEQEQKQKAHDQFEQAKQRIIDDLIYNGVDEAAAREFAENNPLVQQAKAALNEKVMSEQQQQVVNAIKEQEEQWKQLYKTFPDLEESAKAFNKGENPEWYTTEMESMIKAGYKPVDAYKLAHMDKIQSQTKKATEQRLIKEQHLGLRSRVESSAKADDEPQVPSALADAFAAFGLPVESARKYIKK